MQTEIETRFLSINYERLINTIKRKGGKLLHAEMLMRRQTFDNNKLNLKANHTKWLRLRREEKGVTLTLKYYNGEDGVESVKETEILVDDFDTTSYLVQQLDWTLTNEQESLREKWRLYSSEITFDTWPGIERYIDIESPTVDELNTIITDLELDSSKNHEVQGTVDHVYEAVYNIPSGDLKSVPRLTFASWKEDLKKYLSQQKYVS